MNIYIYIRVRFCTKVGAHFIYYSFIKNFFFIVRIFQLFVSNPVYNDTALVHHWSIVSFIPSFHY